jgi:hypothetical protein
MPLHRTTGRPRHPSHASPAGRHAGAAGLALSAIFAVSAVSAPCGVARADTGSVSPDGKGIVGGALLGADVVTIVEGIAGVRQPWAYIVGAVVGAAGGGIGGHFVENGSTDGRAPIYMLAGGLALIIPAVVLSLNATRYQPDQAATDDNAPTGPAAEPGAPGGSMVNAPNVPPPPAATTPAPPPPLPPPAAAPPAPSPPPTPPPQSLFDIHHGSFRLGVPLPDVRPVFSMAEQRQYGLHAETELRMPMLHMTF